MARLVAKNTASAVTATRAALSRTTSMRCAHAPERGMGVRAGDGGHGFYLFLAGGLLTLVGVASAAAAALTGKCRVWAPTEPFALMRIFRLGG